MKDEKEYGGILTSFFDKNRTVNIDARSDSEKLRDVMVLVNGLEQRVSRLEELLSDRDVVSAWNENMQRKIREGEVKLNG